MRLFFAASLLLISVPAFAEGHSEELKPLLQGFDAIEAWQLDTARTLSEAALREQPDRASAWALRADVKMHYGDYVGALYDYEEAHRRGVPDELLRNAPVADAARKATDGYAEAVGEHFIVRYVPGKDSILVPYTLQTLEAAYERIGELLGWRPEGRVLVELYPAASVLADVSSLTPEEIRNSGTIALCRWNRLMVTTPRAVVFGYSWRDTLAHELTHLLIGGASKNTVPIWLHEGIAKYVETAWRGEPGLGISVEQQEALLTAAKKGKLIPFEKMHPSMAKLKTQEETSLAFSEVFTFIEYLVDQKGWEGIRALLKTLSEGGTDAQAVEKVYGESLTTLSQRWMKTLKTRPIKEDPRTAGGKAKKVEIKKQADTPDDALHGVSPEGRRYARAADLLFARGRLKAAQVELQKAYDATGSALIGAKLAMVALAVGDLPAAEKAARESIAGTPDLAGPNVTLAQILVKAGNKEAAKLPLERAIDVNPFDPRIHQLTLEIIEEGKDPAAVAQANRALQLLTGALKPKVPERGSGAFVAIDGPPYQRVYLRREGDSELIPTALLTPTPPFELKPGSYELELVPPAGPARREAIKVLPGSTQSSPQRIVPAGEGS
ncbi:MAG: hypothetical protein IPG45_26635 [Deltaproteobacteria bacterium]|nr:hypothetical protein [Deltaproteobacteria bacterium]